MHSLLDPTGPSRLLLFISFWAGRATLMRLRGNEYDTEKEMGKSSWYPYQSG
jgi:hypothetical protein